MFAIEARYQEVKRPQGKESYNFMLLGKTGAGKSSTGNTLLGRQCFRISHSFTSCSEISGKECNEFSNYIFKVVDTPGIHDMNTSKYEILKNISEGISLIPEGFNAFLFVLKLGERATRELTETINILKALFGDSQFQKSCIIGLTYGDCSDDINNDNIQEWCKNEDNIKVGSVFGTLLRECDYRVVLFYNRHADKREESVSKLLSYVNPQAPRYTNEHFQKCADARDAYMTSLGLPEQRAKKSCIVQ